MTFQGLVAALFSQIVYQLILPYQRTTAAYLIGYGVIVPFWLVFPWIVVDGIYVKNKIFRFCIAAVTPALSIFRTTEGT